MGARNYLIEGVSTTGKTAVCHELRRRGYHAINGDTDLAIQADPQSEQPTEVPSHWHHIWPVATVRQLAADDAQTVTFFCGGSRNFEKFLDVFDAVFVLTVDADTLARRLDARPAGEFGADPEDRRLIELLHGSGEGVPDGHRIDATQPLSDVVEEILRRVNL